MKNAKNIAISSLILAVSFIFLYLASVLPSSKLGCLCVATAGICIIIIENGAKWGFLTSIVLAVLSWFLVPDKTTSLLFIMFFSYYPLIKLFAEKRTRISEWIIKVLYFLIISVAGLFTLKATGLVPEKLLDYFNSIPTLGLLALGVITAECIFDFALSLTISYYTSNIMPKIRKNERNGY